MSFEIPPGYAHCAVELRMVGDPDPWYCTWGVEQPPGGTAATIANHCFRAWEAGPLALQEDDLTLAQAVVKLGVVDSPPLMGYSTARNASGGAAGSTNFLPQNCALLVDKLSDLGGRRGRGRMYVPGILGEGTVDSVGNIANPVVYELAFETFFAALQSNMEGTANPGTVGLDMVILHHDQPTPGVPPTVVTNLHVQNVISTQRKRLR